ncbi:MAG: cytochrome c [Gammaproteobacteria bacterium]|nr:cytochrome c [Gammaproteobacteria bacterium]
MKHTGILLVAASLITSCASEQPISPLDAYEEIDTTTILDAPEAEPGRYFPGDRDAVERGEYLVELLGCGSCHTNGAFEGAPDMSRALAGSNTGIAFTNPLGDKRPGVIYPANITPDTATGIGDWTDRQLANAIRAGIGRHGTRRIASMPWQGYSRLTDDDVSSIVVYLRSIKPVENSVPAEVQPGQKARYPYVYFGVYRSKR